jgi:regulator of protease activity HflC (stomatin/prohibitin superfamily)
LLPAGFSLLILLVYMSIFYVEEHKKAILFRLGEMVASDFKPGPSVNAPIINNVSTFDARVLTLDAKSKHYLTSEKKDAIVDSFAAWQTGDEGFFTLQSAAILVPPIFMREVSVTMPDFTFFTEVYRLIRQRLKKTRIPWR